MKLTIEEFEGMCEKAGVKKESLCDTVFTRQFKEEKEHKIIPINPDKFDEILIRIGRKKQNSKEIKEVKGK